jgi:N-acetyl-gamma-glutamyl-phosphate reductase
LQVVFVPHLAPLTRGLLATVYMELAEGVSASQVTKAYQAAYAEEELVSFLPFGTMPQTGSVAGSSRAQVGVAIDDHGPKPMLVASCAIDNLGKGAATQAMQAANVALGFAEATGLSLPSPIV